MTKSVFHHVKVSGISVVVPQKEVHIEEEIQYYNNDIQKVQRIKELVGLSKRRVVEGNVSAGDLSFQAAQNLIDDMSINVSDIDALVFVVQNPDFSCPATACILHNRLKLEKNCLAFDVNQGCAGYIYGLWLAGSLVESGACKKVLLCAGDAFSAKCCVQNRTTAPVFGDAGSATLIEYCSKESISYFSLGTDGTGYENIIVPGGGAKIPFMYSASDNGELCQALINQENVSHLIDLYMDGLAVFNFTMTVIPEHIKDLMKFAGVNENNIDVLVLHQANKQIIQNIGRKVGFSSDKVPFHTLENYGNQTIASIPSVICDVLREDILHGKKHCILSGFGVGLSWASCILTLDHVFCLEIKDYCLNEVSETRDELIKKWKSKICK